MFFIFLESFCHKINMILMLLITAVLFGTIQTTWILLFSLLMSIANIVLTVIVKGNSKHNSEDSFV